MYKDIFESIRNEAEKRNLRERTSQQPPVQLVVADCRQCPRHAPRIFLYK